MVEIIRKPVFANFRSKIKMNRGPNKLTVTARCPTDFKPVSLMKRNRGTLGISGPGHKGRVKYRSWLRITSIGRFGGGGSTYGRYLSDFRSPNRWTWWNITKKWTLWKGGVQRQIAEFLPVFCPSPFCTYKTSLPFPHIRRSEFHHEPMTMASFSISKSNCLLRILLFYIHIGWHKCFP